MFLHIVGDEKFIDFAIEQFEEEANGQNKFVILSEHESFQPQFIRNLNLIHHCRLGSEEYNELLKEATSFKAIFIHYLDEPKIRFINDCPTFVNLVWMFWGQDAQKLYVDHAYLPRTRRLVKKMYGWNEYLWPYTNWIRRLYLPFTTRGKVMAKIKFCAPVIREELDLVNRKFSLKYKYIDFNYGSIESNFKGNENQRLTGNNILIGNSSTSASNHKDAFELLKSVDLKDKKIIVPLSYGNETYRDLIVKAGQSMFSNSFIPITDFVPLSEYNDILGTCKYVIMNHLRQQALGNIQISLWRGAMVFMNDFSILYKSLKNQGYVVFSIQKDLIRHLQKNENLTEDNIDNNRQLLLQNYGKRAIQAKTKAIIDFFNNQSISNG